jgi:hypothetical protein
MTARRHVRAVRAHVGRQLERAYASRRRR